MNTLNTAADLLRKGWCRDDYQEDDKFCALGAIAVASGVPLLEDEGNYYFDDYNFSESPEVRALARVIVEQYPERFEDFTEDTIEIIKTEESAEVVYLFNDDQNTVEPVIAVMEKAALLLEEE